jgi:hypothetical protein
MSGPLGPTGHGERKQRAVVNEEVRLFIRNISFISAIYDLVAVDDDPHLLLCNRQYIGFRPSRGLGMGFAFNDDRTERRMLSSAASSDDSGVAATPWLRPF